MGKPPRPSKKSPSYQIVSKEQGDAGKFEFNIPPPPDIPHWFGPLASPPRRKPRLEISTLMSIRTRTSGIMVPAFTTTTSSQVPLGLDGVASNNVASGSSISVVLTTSNSNVIVIVCALRNAGAITSVNDTAGLAYSLIADVGVAPQNISAHWAKSATALSGDTISVTLDSTTFITVHAFGVAGANFTTPFDSNAALPATTIMFSSEILLTTTNPNDFLWGTYRFTATTDPAAGGAWTTIAGNNFLLTEYQIVSATQTNTPVTIATSAGSSDERGGIGSAIAST